MFGQLIRTPSGSTEFQGVYSAQLVCSGCWGGIPECRVNYPPLCNSTFCPHHVGNVGLDDAGFILEYLFIYFSFPLAHITRGQGWESLGTSQFSSVSLYDAVMQLCVHLSSFLAYIRTNKHFFCYDLHQMRCIVRRQVLAAFLRNLSPFLSFSFSQSV